jgi:hypothetical protein
MPEVQISLSPSAVRALSKPVVGKGGHQTLLRRLQKQMADGQLTITADDMEKMLRYMLSYGSGGFQQRLAAATGRRSTPRKK